ncbi:hypothetical protein EXN50_05620 [Clostridium botulinum]|nr:hypothetical protein [Clostridium botulinum]
MTNSDLDEFDLAGLNLTEEQKNQFRKLEVEINKIIILLNSFNKDKLNKLSSLAKKSGKNKPFSGRGNKPRTKMWGKNRFYE